MKELEDLKFEKEEWKKRENVFLEQNAFLVTENNELKQQLNRKPQIIYRDVQKQTIDDAASESYTDVLRQRYSPNK
jgi:regulator of replication initiation timing